MHMWGVFVGFFSFCYFFCMFFYIFIFIGENEDLTMYVVNVNPNYNPQLILRFTNPSKDLSGRSVVDCLV